MHGETLKFGLSVLYFWCWSLMMVLRKKGRNVYHVLDIIKILS